MDTLITYHNYLKQKLSAYYELSEANAISKYYICETLSLSNTDFLIKNNQTLNQEQYGLLKLNENRLLKMEPVQHVTETAYFNGLKLKINKSVLIPRQETELLVKIIKDTNLANHKANLIDLGTGSACIPIALSKEVKNLNLYAIDFSKEAINLAKYNANKHKTEINFALYDIIKDKDFPFAEKFDIIVSNPPYVTESEKKQINKNVIEYEPHEALFVPDNNPLVYYEQILKLSKAIGNKNFKIYFEINENFPNELSKLARKYDYTDITVFNDLNNKPRFIYIKS